MVITIGGMMPMHTTHELHITIETQTKTYDWCCKSPMTP